MGIIKTFSPSSNSVISIWKIEESINELRDISKQITDIKNEIKEMEYHASREALKNGCKKLGIDFIGIEKDSNGKPYLKNNRTEISISHKFPYAVVMIHKERACGLDIERIDKKVLKIKDKFLNHDEADYIGESVKNATIYWTIKEALYKIEGEPVAFKKIIIKRSTSKNQFECRINRKNYTIEVDELDKHIIAYTN